MSKLSLDALKERAESVASEDLLKSISGGIQNACHDGCQQCKETAVQTQGAYNGLSYTIIHWLFH